MHHGRAAILCQNAFDRDLIADVTLDDNQRLAGNLLDTLQRRRTTLAKIIENDDLFAGVQEVNANMRTNVARAPRHQDHCRVPCRLFVLTAPCASLPGMPLNLRGAPSSTSMLLLRAQPVNFIPLT